jgi:hypothetical protein
MQVNYPGNRRAAGVGADGQSVTAGDGGDSSAGGGGGESVTAGDGGVLHAILPADRDDVSKLLMNLQKSRLLRLVVLSHQLDETNRQQQLKQQQPQQQDNNINNDKKVAINSDEVVVIVEKPIPEDEILNNFRDSDPNLMKSVYKYWDGDSLVWKSPRLGKCVFSMIRVALECMCVCMYVLSVSLSSHWVCSAIHM